MAAVSQGVVPVAVTQIIAPIVLTTNGYYLINPSSLFTPPFAMGASLGPSSTNNGMNMASGFYITGFGFSINMIGNSSGSPSLALGLQAGAADGTSANLNAWVIVGSGADEAGGVPVAPRNPSGQSIPLNPGSGFLYIVPSVGPGAAPAATSGVNANEPLRPSPPVAPVAPMGPLVPIPPSPGAPFNSSSVEPPAPPGIGTSPSSAPGLPGILPPFPNVSPPLSGTIPTLRGTVPTLNPGR
jgi:hypothetical protein